jgi:hypothetical protein
MAHDTAMILGITAAVIIGSALAGLLFFWLAMVIDACTRTFTKGYERLIWLGILLAFNVFASFIYFFLIKKAHPEGLIDGQGHLR